MARKHHKTITNTKNTNASKSANTSIGGSENKKENKNESKNEILIEDFSENDERLGREFLAEIGSNPQNIKQLLEEFITISYRYEKDVKDAKALYEWLIETLPQAIWVYNSDGSFFYRNSLAINLSEILESLQPQASNQEQTQEIEYKQRTYLIQINSFQNRQLITATDITNQKRQERLASMGQISAHLAHEIRNPIGSMSLLLSTLAKKSNQAQNLIIAELQKSIFRVERIIKATLLFSKGVSANKQPTSIASLEEDLWDCIKTYSYTKDIVFNFEFVDKVCLLDRDLMAMALQNFLFNAIDAIEESELENGVSGEVSIKASIDKDEIIFEIQDNGKPFENPDILFEPFVTTKLKGNGLGLALSLQIIYAHQGRISIDAPNKKFSIVIKKF